MRRQAQLFCLLLWLCLGKIEAADHLCDKECSFTMDVNVSETVIRFSGNHTITNVTFANGTKSNSTQENDSLSGLVPGTQYFVYFSYSNSICCKSITTKPSSVFDIRAESISTTEVNLTWKNDDQNATTYTYRIQIEESLTVRNESTDTTSAYINNLEPGTLYVFQIYPVAPDNETEGEPNKTSLYTKPRPVFDIHAESISTKEVNLTWKNYDQNATTYTYRIQIEESLPVRNESSDTTSAYINNLEPGTLYVFQIYPVAPDNETEGEPNKTSLYTKPSPVFDILIENISSSALTLKWTSSDRNASNYTYVIEIEEDGYRRNISSDTTSTLITNLNPGTSYTFKICPVAADNETVGDPTSITNYTKPSPVVDIQPEDISTTSVSLKWKSDDRNASTYTYLIEVKRSYSVQNVTSNTTSVLIRDLEPGTSYTFKIFPLVADGEVVGEPNDTTLYTKPSPVFDILIENISSSALTLKWTSSDRNASNYTYVIEIEEDGYRRNISSDTTSTLITNLNPGTSYTFKICPVAADNETVGDPTSITNYTKPSPVVDIQPEDISTTSVSLKWKSDDRNASTYTYLIEVKRSYSVQNVTSNTTSVLIRDLEPGTSYTFKIFPLVADGEVVGEPNDTTLYTKPSPVVDIQPEDISTTSVSLKWKSDDRNASTYTYLIEVKRSYSVQNVTSNTTSVLIRDLEPGTSYTFKIFPLVADGEVVGEPNDTTLYTKPSPVFDILIENISSSALTLKWTSSDRNASNYTYVIEIEEDGYRRNISSDTTSTLITNLNPGTSYTFKICPVAADNETVGDPTSITNYTKPSPVVDIQPEDISTTSVSLKWKSDDRNASTYTYLIEVKSSYSVQNVTSNTTSVLIRDLEPGTSYTFKIFPLVADGEVVGEPNDTTLYTKPSPVVDIQPEDISTTSVSLKWKSDDRNASTYTYLIEVKRNYSVQNVTSNTTSVLIRDLEPGTSYTFKVFPLVADGEVVGEPNDTTLYTIPSEVVNITVTDISSTVVNITWNSPDLASPEYFYRILVNGGAIENKTSPITSAIISGLNPGTNYIFSIYSVAQNNKTEGNSSSIDHCTNAAPVNELECNPVNKQAKLLLHWTFPNGTFVGFHVSVLNDSWNTTVFKENETTITDLDYYTNYTVSVTTLSCGKVSIPVNKTCCTSITDPPPPSDPPAVKATNHYSLNVQFDIFNSSHGPITAYAIVVTTSEGAVSNDSLLYTYDDFMKKKTNSYVASVIEVQQKRSSSSDSQHYDTEVGDGSKRYGYINGKLDPLGLYRACVAGFTQIDFNKTIGLINVEKSFVSFSPVSESVLLPQNPDVIIGAVVGCVLAAVIVFVIVGFIFWKKRRSGGKNSDVPFSLIESKSMKVENFESYFKKQKADSNCGFAEEYENLRPVGIHQPKFAAELPESKGKNRYNNVLPYEFSRVKLSLQTHPTDDYINANYMPGYNSKDEFIAAQGPLPTTVQDFWRMIWEKDIYTIVMLTKCVEQGRTKCEEYWPNKQSKSYGDITVAMTSEIVLPEWTIRDFSLEKSDSSKSHPVRQFHFTAWPDHGVPETTDLLINFRHLVQEYMKLHPNSPTLVHCSAGVGRTGTFIALDHLIHQMEMENTVDVYGVVYNLRMHRSLMVQTEDQYVFLNQCVLDIIKSKKERKTDLIYQNTDAMAIYENFTPSPHTGKANGYHV